MSKISTKPPSGMRDFLPEDLARRKYVISVVEEVYRAHGFSAIETPSIENLSTLLGKYGEEGDQLLYRLLHRRDKLSRAVDAACEAGVPAKEADLANQGLRYDLTVPLARVVAQYGELPKYFKRYQIQPVWRADRPGKGRFREFYQCDVDITGTASLLAEAEVCSAVCSVLRELGFEDFVVKLNHRELLRAMIRAAGISAELESTALVAVDKLDKIGREGVLKELAERGVSAEAGAHLLDTVSIGSGDEEMESAAILAALEERVDDRGRDAIAGLRELLDLCADGPAGSHLRVSPELARGLSYYTGPIFEISVADLAGSLGGGGRYDGLIGMFGKNAVPAVGFSIGLERILVVMAQREMYPELSIAPDVLLCWTKVPGKAVLACAAKLREAGVRVEVYPEDAKLKKQLGYADTVGVRYAAILGEDELAAGELTLKELESGDQARLGMAEAVARVMD
jgi:histidyl-tRNA synthetase